MYAGWKRNDNPIKKNIIADASQGFHMFQAHTWNFCLQKYSHFFLFRSKINY